MVADPLPVLQRVFGFGGFRGVQADVVARVLAGRRTLAVMPTGAGKSLCYQLPSVMMEGTCVVVSPLIALMHDQLRAAEAVGIRAATLTSADQNRAESIARFRAGELEEACESLEELLPVRAFTDSDRSQIVSHLGFCAVAAGERQAASDYFTKWIELDPRAQLDPITTSPKILEVFYEVREKRAGNP